MKLLPKIAGIWSLEWTKAGAGMARRRWIISSFLVLLTACGLAKIDPRAETVAHLAFEEVHRSVTSGIPGPHFAPALASPDAQQQLAQLRPWIPAEAPRGRETVNWTFFTSTNAGKTVTLDEVYDYGEREALVHTVLHWPNGSEGDDWQLQGFYFRIATHAQLTVNDFTLSGKSLAQYGYLGLAVLSPVLMLCALVKVIRTKGLRRKWLWGILCLIGIFSLKLNWATGQMAFNWMTIQLIGSGATRGASHFSSWVLTTSIPIGALLVLTGLVAKPAKRDS